MTISIDCRLGRPGAIVGVATFFALAGVGTAALAPAWAQAVLALTPSHAAAITEPMVVGIEAAGADIGAVEGVIATSIVSAITTYPNSAAAILQAVVAADEGAEVSAEAIGAAVGQAVSTLAANAQTANLALALAAAVSSVLNQAEQTAFNIATANVTIGGQRLANAVAALRLQAQQITSAIPGAPGGTNQFGGGGLPPGCVPTTSVTHCCA
jgi:hypothetical protein